MGDQKNKLPLFGETSSDVQGFLEKLASVPAVSGGHRRGRLVFGMDATASREATWDQACHIQSEMFLATEGLGGLDVQLIFYRGFGECKATPLGELLHGFGSAYVLCDMSWGRTQIRKIFQHTLRQNKIARVNALVFVGDCIEEDVDKLCDLAGQLGVIGVPIFVFQEGYDPAATRGFKQFARLTGGAHCHFDGKSAEELKSLLGAVAVFASGGFKALQAYETSSKPVVSRISSQVK